MRWLDSTDLTPASRRTSKSRLNTHWMPHIGPIPVDQIRYTHLREVMAEKANLAAKTRRNILSDLKSVLGLDLDFGYIKENPAKSFGRIKGQAAEIDPFSREERDAILSVLTGSDKLFCAIGFYCGLRPGETIALLWSDYDGESLEVNKQTVDGKLRYATKTNKSRTVMVHPYVQKLLRDHPTPFRGGHILLKDDAEPYTSYFRFGVTFNKVRDQLEIRHRSPYNCRHTAATMMLRATGDAVWVSQQLGNSVEMVFRNYSGIIYEDRDAEMRKRVEEYL